LNLAICYAIMPMVFLVACGEPVRLAEHKTVRIAEDSNRLQKVIRDEETLQQNDPRPNSGAERQQLTMAEHNAQTPPRRRELLSAFALAPGFDIAGTTEADILETSAARCTLSHVYTNRFVKIRIASGPFRGRIGWVCDDQVRRLNMWP
jgi:hypothetical protein